MRVETTQQEEPRRPQAIEFREIVRANQKDRMKQDHTLNEQEIRAALHARLSRRKDGIIRHEMGLQAHSRRIDMAFISKVLEGFEIKGETDSLSRLPKQAADYQKTFRKLTLVTTCNHLERAREILPEHWGIILASRNGRRRTVLRTLKKPALNAHDTPLAVAQLLWREEALEELRRRGLARGMSHMARHHIWKRLAEKLTQREIMALAVKTLTQRAQGLRWTEGSTAAQAR